MVDITEISAMVAAAGVLAGVVYYILEIRQQTKARQDMARTIQTDLLMIDRSESKTWTVDDDGPADFHTIHGQQRWLLLETQYSFTMEPITESIDHSL